MRTLCVPFCRDGRGGRDGAHLSLHSADPGTGLTVVTITAMGSPCDAIDPIALPFVGHQSQAKLLLEGARERSTYRVRQPAGRCHDLRDGRTLRSLERPGDRCLLAVVAGA